MGLACRMKLLIRKWWSNSSHCSFRLTGFYENYLLFLVGPVDPTIVAKSNVPSSSRLAWRKRFGTCFVRVHVEERAPRSAWERGCVHKIFVVIKSRSVSHRSTDGLHPTCSAHLHVFQIRAADRPTCAKKHPQQHPNRFSKNNKKCVFDLTISVWIII